MAAVRSGRLSAEQVALSAERVLRLKHWLGLFEERLTDPSRIEERVATPELRALAQEVARRAVTVLEDRALPLRPAAAADCLLIVNGRDTAWNEDMEYALLPTHERLLRAARQRLPGLRTVVLSESMSPEELAEAGRLAAAARTVVCGLFTRVLCYHEDAIGLDPGYTDLIRRMAATDTALVLLNFGNPYIMADLPTPAASLCTYDEACPESIEAAVEVLFGEIAAQGKLPVRVSAQYPFGFGRG